MSDTAEHQLLIICLCAEWCGTCRDYRAGFDALAAEFPGARFRWLDIEDGADELGDLDIENFPTVLIRRRGAVLFFGTLLPHLGHLRRLIETLAERSPEDEHAATQSTPEHRDWQHDADLAHLGDLFAYE